MIFTETITIEKSKHCVNLSPVLKKFFESSSSEFAQIKNISFTIHDSSGDALSGSNVFELLEEVSLVYGGCLLQNLYGALYEILCHTTNHPHCVFENEDQPCLPKEQVNEVDPSINPRPWRQDQLPPYDQPCLQEEQVNPRPWRQDQLPVTTFHFGIQAISK